MKVKFTSLLPLALLKASNAGLAARHVNQIEQRDSQAQPTDAPKLANSPGNSYMATFSSQDNSHGIHGSVKISSNVAGPAWLEVKFDALPADKQLGIGPLAYHIHEHPVQILANGTYNCTATGGHFDPYSAGEATKCDPEKPQTCQVGDLSGKHGGLKIDNGASNQKIYYDPYISTSPGNGNDDLAHAFIGEGRSIVVHGENKARLACMNLVQVKSDHGESSIVPAPTGTAAPTQVGGGSGNVPWTATASGCSCASGSTPAATGGAAPCAGGPAPVYPMPNGTVSALPSTLMTAPGNAPTMSQPTDGASGVTGGGSGSGGDAGAATSTTTTATATGPGLSQSTGAGAAIRPPVQGLLSVAVVLGALGLGVGL